MVSEPVSPHNLWAQLFSVERGLRMSCPGRRTYLWSDCAYTQRLSQSPPSVVPCEDGGTCGQTQPVGDTAVLSYIIIRAAKSSSKRRNCQNKGCQSNFNSTSWQICLLMGSLITSSQPTFSSARLLLYSGHDGQTAINEGPVNILFGPFFIQCVALGIICHMPSNPSFYSSSLSCVSVQQL